jgi:hypothetical protein
MSLSKPICPRILKDNIFQEFFLQKKMKIISGIELNNWFSAKKSGE